MFQHMVTSPVRSFGECLGGMPHGRKVHNNSLMGTKIQDRYQGDVCHDTAIPKWDAVNFETNHICVKRVRDQYGLRAHTKGKKIRYIKMNSVVRKILSNLKENCGDRPDHFVFLKNQEKAFDTVAINAKFDRCIVNAKLNKRLRFHDLRHTFATHFLLNGGNISMLQKILGHANISETQRYGHLEICDFKGAEEFVCF